MTTSSQCGNDFGRLLAIIVETTSESGRQGAASRRSSATSTTRHSQSYSQFGTEVIADVDNSVDPLYTFEEFLRFEAENDSSVGAPTSLTTPSIHRFHFYDNAALEPDQPSSSAAAMRRSNRPPELIGRFDKNANGEHVGFYVVNDQRPNAAPIPLEESRHSVPQPLSVFALASESPAVDTQTQTSESRPTAAADRLHPILRRTFTSILNELFCSRCQPTPQTDEEEFRSRMCADCWHRMRDCFSTTRRRGNRADQYRVAEPVVEAVPQPQFSWDRERPPRENFMFSKAEDAVLVKRNGDISGQQFIIENCQNCVIMVLDNLGSVTIDDCKSCAIVLGPCSGSVFIRDCTDCTLFTACQQFRTRDCSIMVHLFCATSPVIEESTVQFFPLFLKYPFIEENLSASGLSPFTNYWYKVHDFTPETSHYTVSEQPKPLGVTYGPSHDWFPDLKQERVSLDPNDSYFLFTPSSRSVASGQERVLTLFNLPLSSKEPTRQSFYQTVIALVHRLTADKVRLVVAHDLDVREGEFGNIIGRKSSINGKLVSVELAGPSEECRPFVDNILSPTRYSGIRIILLEADQTELYRKNINRLADVQSHD